MGIVHSGALNPNWKGGRSIASNGYVLVRIGVGHHLADVRGYAYEHRVVAERMLGRRLCDGEQVHHKDGNKTNNDPSNLEVLLQAEHHVEHRGPDSRLRLPGEDNPEISCRCGCGSRFPRYDGAGRPREWVSGHNPSKAPVQDALLEVLRGADGPQTRQQLCRAARVTKAAASAALKRMLDAGVVRRARHGQWEVSR